MTAKYGKPTFFDCDDYRTNLTTLKQAKHQFVVIVEEHKVFHAVNDAHVSE
jgi:hypothetical protein